MPVATHEEIANMLREHYARISSYAGSRFPTMGEAIDAWECEPELLERIEEKDEELERLRKEDEIWDKHSLTQIVMERNELKAEVETLQEDSRARRLLWYQQKKELESDLAQRQQVTESLGAGYKVMTRQIGEVMDIIRNTPIIELVKTGEHLWKAIPRWADQITDELLTERKHREEAEEILAQFFAKALDIDAKTKLYEKFGWKIHGLIHAMKGHPAVQRATRREA